MAYGWMAHGWPACRRPARGRSGCSSSVLPRAEGVPEAAHCVDHRRPAPVDLSAQAGDADLDQVAAAVEGAAPDVVEDLRLAEHLPGVAHHQAEQVELLDGELDRYARAVHL